MNVSDISTVLEKETEVGLLIVPATLFYIFHLVGSQIHLLLGFASMFLPSIAMVLQYHDDGEAANQFDEELSTLEKFTAIVSISYGVTYAFSMYSLYRNPNHNDLLGVLLFSILVYLSVFAISFLICRWCIEKTDSEGRQRGRRKRIRNRTIPVGLHVDKSRSSNMHTRRELSCADLKSINRSNHCSFLDSQHVPPILDRNGLFSESKNEDFGARVYDHADRNRRRLRISMRCDRLWN